MDQIRPTPRNAFFGLLADALSGADAYANKSDSTMPMGKSNPILALLSNAIGVGAAGRTADRASYGLPLMQGAGQTLSMLPDTRDTFMAAASLAAKSLTYTRGLLNPENGALSMTYGLALLK
jgi:hypothetical protein